MATKNTATQPQNNFDTRAIRRALSQMPPAKRRDAVRAILPSDTSTPGFPGSLEELAGLLTGIKACVEVARKHYDSDHLNLDGLWALVERADIVVLELEHEEREREAKAQ